MSTYTTRGHANKLLYWQFIQVTCFNDSKFVTTYLQYYCTGHKSHNHISKTSLATLDPSNAIHITEYNDKEMTFKQKLRVTDYQQKKAELIHVDQR